MRHRHLRAPAAATLVGLAGLVGCATAPPPAPPALAVVPAQFKAPPHTPFKTDALTAPADSAPPIADGAWWRLFADPALDPLQARAEANNTDIATAGVRLTQARALLAAQAASSLPQVNAGAGASRQGGPLLNSAGASGNLFTAYASVAWEPDLFGRAATQRDAAALDARSSAALLHSTRLLVQAEVTQTWLALRAADTETLLAQEAVAAWRETMQLTQGRMAAGSLALQAGARAQADLAAAEAELPVLQRQRAALENALALLLGEAAPSFSLPPATAPAALVAPPPVVPAGIPSAVLQRRPDVAAAQWALQAALARVGTARSAWFPTVALTASGGQASADLGRLLQTSLRAWGLSALLVAPLFDGGQREAGLRQAEAEAEAALLGLRARMLVALREVEDQLSALQALAAQADRHARAEQAAQQTLALTSSRLRQGLASRFELLDAQRSALALRRQALHLGLARQQATVALVRALGGGWGDSPPASTTLALGR